MTAEWLGEKFNKSPQFAELNVKLSCDTIPFRKFLLQLIFFHLI